MLDLTIPAFLGWLAAAVDEAEAIMRAEAQTTAAALGEVVAELAAALAAR